MNELPMMGPTSLDEFLEHWYGPQTKPASAAPSGVPSELAHWYEIAGCWDSPVTNQNHLLTPDQFTREGDRVVFYVENQGVWLWAFDPTSGEDPLVFDRENESGRVWQPTDEVLSEFLVHVAVFEVVVGSPIGATAIDLPRAQLDQILRPLKPLPLPAWAWPGLITVSTPATMFWLWPVSTTLLAPVQDDSVYEVFIAGKSLESLAYLDDIAVRWERHSRDLTY